MSIGYYCFGGYIESFDNIDKSEAIEHLEININRVIDEIKSKMLRRVSDYVRWHIKVFVQQYSFH